jgi:D-glycero-D-manno-heptose 1,7-bisphosphate phosphatase
VTTLDEDQPLSLILRWKPERYIQGGGYRTGSLGCEDSVRAYGGVVDVIAPRYPTSTSAILEKLHALSLHAHPEAVPPQTGPLVMLDRDGTLIRNIPYLHDPEKVEILPGVIEGLAKLVAAGFRLAVVTNQPGIGLGYHTTGEFIAVNRRMVELLAPSGARMARFFFCPHSAAEHCPCRKPASGLLLRALRELDAAPQESVFIGDTDVDMEAAYLPILPNRWRTIRIASARSVCKTGCPLPKRTVASKRQSATSPASPGFGCNAETGTQRNSFRRICSTK